jgi:hydrogenase maturation protease
MSRIFGILDASGAPGTIHVIEPEPGEPAAEQLMLASHVLDPARVLRMVSAVTGRCRQILRVGWEPRRFGDELRGEVGLSEPVTAAVE